MQSLKNFLIAFGAGLVVFGLFAYAVTGLLTDKDKGNIKNENNGDEIITENVFASGDPENPESSATGSTFTAVVGGYDQSGKELDALIFIKADRENMRFVLSSIPTNLKAPITSAAGLPSDGTENINLDSDITFVESHVPIKDFPAKFPGKAEQMVVDTVTLITGMPIDFYAFLDYNAVYAIFNETSGLHFDVPKDMVYIGNGTEEKPEFVLSKGSQVLNADKAIALMRFAGDTNNERSNFNERAKRQANFLSSAMTQALKRKPDEIISGIAKVLSKCSTNFTAEDFAENFELISKFEEYGGNNVVVTFDNYRSEVLNYFDTARRFVNYK